nr:homocysteine S-methyltransferase [Nakamurella flavida]
MAAGPLVLDGGLSTGLERRGHDLRTPLWTALQLLEDPGAIGAVHGDFFRAGAQVAITASYQVSYSGFAAAGLDDERTEAALRESVALARRAAQDSESGEGPRWVAASVGPYGAAQADGSEYRGDDGLTVAQLRAWHRARLQVLMEAGADVLALETVPSAREAEALLAEVAGTGRPAWLSLTCARGRTRDGVPAEEAFALAREVPEVVAVGVNCVDPAEADTLIALAAQASGKPVVVYPNGGRRWDGAAREWTGSPTALADRADGWITAGARLVGGCCEVGPDELRPLAERVRRADRV